MDYLNFELLPNVNEAYEIYNISKYYCVSALVEKLEHFQPVILEVVRSKFFTKMSFHENIRKLIELGKNQTLKSNGPPSVIVKFVIQRVIQPDFKTDGADRYRGHACDCDVVFGLWEGAPTPEQFCTIISEELSRIG